MTRAPTILLRAFAEEDVPFFTSLAQDERVTTFVGDGRPWSAEKIDDRSQPALRRDPLDLVGASRWFIAEEHARAVGLFVSTRREHAIEIGYWVAPRSWGRGAAGAMLDRALPALPDLWGTHRFLARVAPENIASARVLIRRGFEHRGRSDGAELYTRERAGSAVGEDDDERSRIGRPGAPRDSVAAEDCAPTLGPDRGRRLRPCTPPITRASTSR